MKFLLNESNELHRRTNSPLAAKFIEDLEARIKDRREPLINTLILYLNDHGSLSSGHPLKLASKAATERFGIAMLHRLFPRDQEQLNSTQSQAAATSPACSLQERLQMSIGSVSGGSSPQEEVEDDDPYKKEFELYGRFHGRGPFLNKLFDALCTVQPTSTQSERNFSLATAVLTKSRSRLGSEKLNAICVLKNYFKNLKK